MRVSSRADYGVRALFDLAQHYGQGPVQSREIANRQHIPEAYLHQVLGSLGRAGLIRSTRGPQGGHQLVRSPGEVTVLAVLEALDGPDRRSHPHLQTAGDQDIVHALWHDLQCQASEFLRSVTLETLLDRSRSTRPVGTYSI